MQNYWLDQHPVPVSCTEDKSSCPRLYFSGKASMMFSYATMLLLIGYYFLQLFLLQLKQRMF